MTKGEILTLKLKFKRHEIKFNYDEKKETFYVGKINKASIITGYLFGSIILFISPLMSFVFIKFIASNTKNISEDIFVQFFMYSSIIGILIGVYLIKRTFKLGKNNKSKSFSKENITLNQNAVYEKSRIQDFSYKIEKYKGEFIGELFIILPYNGKKTIIKLADKNSIHLKSDFEYLIKILKKRYEK